MACTIAVVATLVELSDEETVVAVAVPSVVAPVTLSVPVTDALPDVVKLVQLTVPPETFVAVVAVALFDVGAFLVARNAPGTVLPMEARLLGFVIGIVAMVAVPTLAGSPARAAPIPAQQARADSRVQAARHPPGPCGP